MARPPKNHAAAAEFGERLRAIHAESGKPTPKQIELWVWDAFGSHISDETIRKAHKGEADPNACDPELILALAAYYDVEVKDLGPHAARRTLTVLTMASPERDELPPRIHDAVRSVQLDLFGFAA